ncbi:MAG: glycosyltransferase family 87 protein [Cyanobacteriota bacterium]
MLAPLAFLAYLGLESYGIDYRAFYLAGKSALSNLNPYLNQLSHHPDFYGPVNSELGLYAGWKYPPLTTYLFTPLALLDYESSKNLFNALSLSATIAALLLAIRGSARTLAPESVLIVMISFPMLTTIERGQIDLLLMVIALGALELFRRGQAGLSGLVVAMLAAVKLFPLLLALGFTRQPRLGRQALWGLGLTLMVLSLLTLLICPHPWITTFITRSIHPFAMPPGPIRQLPPGLGIVDATTTVLSSDSRPLIVTHAFTNGYANPLLSSNTIGSLLIGFCGAGFSLWHHRHQPLSRCFFAIMPWLNIINPISWTMGLCWYFPYFLDNYRHLSPGQRFLLSLPLILPPMLNVSGYLAAAATLLLPWWSRTSLPSDTLSR